MATTTSDQCNDTTSLAAMTSAINASGGGAELFLWTNTSPADAADVDMIVALAAAKGVRVWSFLWDQSGVLTCTASPDNSTFQALAAATGGQAFYPTKDDLMGDASLVLAALDLYGGNVAGGGGSFPAGGNASEIIPVDMSMESVTVTSLGATKLSLKRPDGSTVMSSDPGVTVSGAGTRQVATINAPQPGMWTVTLTGTGNYTFQAFATSALSIDQMEFVEERGRAGHPGYERIPGAPLANQMATLDVLLSTTIQNPMLELRDAMGAPLAAVAPTASANGNGTDLVASVMVPNVPFTVHVVGSDSSANGVERVAEELITPRTLTVTPPAFVDALPLGKPSTLTFTVTNMGNDGLFIIVPSDDAGYVMPPTDDMLVLANGESKNIDVVVSPKADTQRGAGDVLLLTITGGTARTTNSASVDLTFGDFVNASGNSTGCSCDLGRGRPSAAWPVATMILILLGVAGLRRRQGKSR